MSERGEGPKNRGVSAPGAGRESSGRKDIKDFFKPAAEMVAKISSGDVESLYGLREWWAGNVSDVVFNTEPVTLTFSKDGKKRIGNFGVPLGERKLYCSEQVDEAELDEDKMAKWDFLKERMSAAAADGLTERWGADGIKSSLASAGGDEEKERALIRQWIGGQNGPLAGLEGEVLNRLKGVVVDDEEIGMRVVDQDGETEKGKKKKRSKKQALIEATEALVNVAGQMSRASQEMSPYERAQYELLENMRTVSLDELVDAYLYIRAPRERGPQNWEYKVPDWLPNTTQEQWRKLLSYSDQWLGAIYRKRGDGRYNNDLKYVREEVLNMQQATEGLLHPWFNHPDLQVRGVMNQVMHDLMMPHEFKGVVDGKNVTRVVYLFKTKQDPNDPTKQVYSSSYVRDFVVDEGKYKDGLVQRLVEKGGVLEGKDLRAAKMAVALAMDIMEMGGVFTTADSLRRLSWESDAIRIAQRPETKLRAKGMDGEVWGGPWLEYCLQGTDDTAAAYIRAKGLGIVPVLLSGSFMDLPYRVGSDTKTFADRIWGNEDFNIGEGDSDLFFSWRKDHLNAAIDLWSHISGRAPFELKQYREFDNTVTQWRTGLRNAYDQLQKNSDSLCTVELMSAAIGGSTGLWPFEGPYIRVSGAQGDQKRQSAFEVMFGVGYEIITNLGLSPQESGKVMKFFGLDRRNRVHFGDQIIDYQVVQNPRSSESLRKRALRSLWKNKRKY